MITKIAKKRKPTSILKLTIDQSLIDPSLIYLLLQEVKSTRQCSLTQPNTRTNSHSRPGRRSPFSTRTRQTGGRGSATERLEFSPATMLNHWNVSHLWIEHFESKQELKGSSSFLKEKLLLRLLILHFTYNNVLAFPSVLYFLISTALICLLLEGMFGQQRCNERCMTEHP